MVIIVDLMGDEETIVLDGPATVKETPEDVEKRKLWEREEMMRQPVPTLQIVPNV